MTYYRLTYNGNHKIDAIKMVRRHTGYGLKESMRGISNPNGLIVSAEVAEKIIMDYLAQGFGFIGRFHAWEVRLYVEAPAYDMRYGNVADGGFTEALGEEVNR